jgi:ferredoxin
MKIVADREICIGSGMCVLIASELFGQDETEGLVAVLKPKAEGREAEAARRAVVSCPTRALSIDEETCDESA